MSRIRIKFRKNGTMRFIGHLDTMRYFQKAMRRAGIDIAYSEGFSPHQLMSFAAPMGVGLTSDGEYLDIVANTTASSAESIAALNATMAEGVEITAYVELRQNAKKAMTAVAAADYLVYFRKEEDFSMEELTEKISAYYQREEIQILKQGKKSERLVDVKPLIYDFAPYQDETVVRPEELLTVLDSRRGFYLKLCTGSTDNIKPELILQDFYQYWGREYHPFNLQIHRLDVYERIDDQLLPLSMAGDEIL